MSAERLYHIDQARGVFASALEIETDAALLDTNFVQELKQALKPATPGSCPVVLRYDNGSARAEIALGPEWRVNPTSLLLERLAGLAGDGRARLIYPPTRRTLSAVESPARSSRRIYNRAGVGALTA